MYLGIDIGGTFTDVLAFSAHDGRILGAVKLPSTPARPSDGAIEGLDRITARTGERAHAVFHGTTVGTNTLIQHRGARTALVTTAGFRDVLALRRQARPRLYDLNARVSDPLVDADLRLEVPERLAYDGSVIEPLTPESLEALIASLRRLRVESVAIACLHSYANDAHEQQLEAAVRAAFADVYVTRSSDVVREFREFERTSTTVVNAYIGPAVSTYLEGLEQALASRGIQRLGIVKSNGGIASAQNAARYPVHLIESGPAAGVIATAALGHALKLPNLIAFDMGGTTAKVGVVVEGQPRLSTEFYADRFVDGLDVGGYPVQSPVVDLIEIGAGGGSIAYVDELGVLKVGPASAGADPGPACYGRGGTDATVTDAHVVMGHIDARGFGSEDLELDAHAAHKAVRDCIALPLGWTVERAAAGILRLATANMAEMVRLATLRRGLDPRDFALVAFGGGGGLHAADIAREVGVPTVLIPPLPGLFSAIGTVLGDVRHDLVQTRLTPLADLNASHMQAAFTELFVRASDLQLNDASVDANAQWVFEKFCDLRFERQLFELSVPLPDALIDDTAALIALLDAGFRRAHESAYGYDLEGHGVELVNIRLVAKAQHWSYGWPVAAARSPHDEAPSRTRERVTDDGSRAPVTVFDRARLAPGNAIEGPAIIEDFGATIRVLEAQQLVVTQSGALRISELAA